MKIRLDFFSLLSVLLVALGCSRLMPPPQADPGEISTTAFMGSDFNLLHRGDSDRGEYAALAYVDPKTKFGQYNKVIVDPVTVWGRKKDNYDGMSRQEVQALADIFYSTLREELAKDYQIVERAGPGTMRIRAALTRAEESMPGLDFISTVVPFGRAAAEAQNLAVGKTPFVGGATVEVKINDASTGKLLSAAVDQRYGQKRIEKGFDSAADVKYLFRYWAKALRYRLCEKSGRSGCEAP